jgi:hypothetical protein
MPHKPNPRHLPPEVAELFARDGEWSNTQFDLFFLTCDCDRTAYCRRERAIALDTWFTYCSTPGCTREGRQEVGVFTIDQDEATKRKPYAKQFEQAKDEMFTEMDSILKVAALIKNPTTPDGKLLDQITDTIRRYVFMGRDEAVIATLFVVHTWCVEASEFTPYIHLRSALPRSGKSRMLDVLEFLVARPLRVHDPTPAAIADALLFADVFGKQPPTILWDEIDNAYKRWGGLREIVNAGFQRGTYIARAGGVQKPTFSPKVMSGLGRIPQTVFDRSFEFDMTRAMRDERPIKLTPTERRALRTEVEDVREHLEAFAERHLESLADPDVSLPDELDDRGQDISEPLLAIADIVSGEWPTKARKAMVAVRNQMFASESASMQEHLLHDIRRVFGERDVMHSAALVEELRDLEDGPWKARGLTQWSLADRVREFSEYPGGPRIESQRMRVDGKQKAAYRRAQFEDAFKRYLGDDDEV